MRLQLNLAPPLLSRRDPVTGHPRKRSFGPWALRLMPLLARARALRGTALDPFSRTAERRAERALIADYEALIDRLLRDGIARDLQLATELAELPDQIRGFGHVKAAAMNNAAARQADLMAQRRGRADAMIPV